MMSREDARTYAGLLAASSVVASKQISLRDSPPAGLPAQLRPSSLNDLARLFGQDKSEENNAVRRVARLSSAALVYSVDKTSPVQPAKILRDHEKEVLGVLDKARATANTPTTGAAHARRDRFKGDRSCPHCRLLYGSLYPQTKWGDLPPIAVVNHSARVNVTFDPDTNISEAMIKNFQVIVPETVAKMMIGLSHPLRWADPAGSLFQRSDPVDANGDDLRGDPYTAEKEWKEGAESQGGAFIYEDVVWPVNEDLSAASENIIKIRELFDRDDHLRYKYSLERCVRSNFGIAWEPSGLDIDGGFYDGLAIPVRKIGTAAEAQEILGELKKRDILEMSAKWDPDVSAELYKGWVSPEGDKVELSTIVETVWELGLRLEKRWPTLSPFYLVNVSASKELHFTIPENGPIELWDILTWTAPAILFTFLNRAICLAPHLLIDDLDVS
jgi:hypothetical protein